MIDSATATVLDYSAVLMNSMLSTGTACNDASETAQNVWQLHSGNNQRTLAECLSTYLLSQIKSQTPVSIVIGLQEFWQLCQVIVPHVCSEKLNTPQEQQSLHKVIWEEGRVAVLSHTYAVKSPLVTMACSKFAPNNAHSHKLIPKSHYLPHSCTRPTYDAKWHTDLIRRFSTMHWTDRRKHARPYARMYVHMYRPTDHPQESLTNIGRCATRMTQPNNSNCIKKINKTRPKFQTSYLV